MNAISSSVSENDRGHQRLPSVTEQSTHPTYHRKRSFTQSIEQDLDTPGNKRKTPKVTRACDECKSKKAKCSGTRPCESCLKRGSECLFEASYTRGKARTPPPAVQNASEQVNGTASREDVRRLRMMDSPLPAHGVISRASPEVELADLEGQFIDPTSGLSFLHRAWKRLASQKQNKSSKSSTPLQKRSGTAQPLMRAGDRPFDVKLDIPLVIPGKAKALELVHFYFDTCVVTYRCLHQQTVIEWANTMVASIDQGKPIHYGTGYAEAALLLTIFAIASSRQEKLRHSAASDGQDVSFKQGDPFFYEALKLTEAENGMPRLESAQARLLQVLYLLQTFRMNQAWYTFGNTFQIISALGLHRHSSRRKNGTPRSLEKDYIQSQCRKRTFWVAYTIDKYLGTVLGRPRHYHDDDIDQSFPERINDEDMTRQGPSNTEAQNDCTMDAAVFHVR
jgi:hypothetical protein